MASCTLRASTGETARTAKTPRCSAIALPAFHSTHFQTYPRLVPLDHQIDLFASGQFHMTYTDTKGQLYQLGLEDSETCRTIEEESKRDESKRMHREPVPVDMSSIHGIRFKKLRCSFTESYGITDDGDVYKSLAVLLDDV